MKGVTVDKDTGQMVATETLCVTRDGRIVPEDDPEANMVLAARGQVVPKKMAERYGIEVPGKAKEKEQPKEQPAAEEQPKEQPAPAEEPEEHPQAAPHAPHRRGK